MKPIEFNAYDTELNVSDNGTMSGYAVVWGVVDNKGDIHHKGAYSKTIEQNQSFPLLPNHDQNDPIGYTTSVVEDDHGLKFEANFASTDTAQKYRTLMQEGVVKKVSMGWSALRWSRNENGGRNIHEVKLFEISPVVVPVGEETMILEVNNVDVTQEKPDVLDRFYGLAKNIGDKKFKLSNQAELLKLAEEYKKVTQPSEDTAPTEVTKANSQDEFLTKLNNELKIRLKK